MSCVALSCKLNNESTADGDVSSHRLIAQFAERRQSARHEKDDDDDDARKKCG